MGLWQVLETDASEQNVANVKGLVTYATGKLILVRETFPDYTMHDRQHAENVVKLAEQLLGPSIGDLTPLEAAVLILVAYFHDIGMVYTPDELDALVEDEDFRNFLDENPTAYVRAHQYYSCCFSVCDRAAAQRGWWLEARWLHAVTSFRPSRVRWRGLAGGRRSGASGRGPGGVCAMRTSGGRRRGGRGR
jgi:hypothetical protein